MEERQAWESDLKKMKEKIEIKTRDLDISKQNNEKLQRALFSLENKTGKGQENKLLEEIDQWKQRNSLLEIKLQEMKPIEKRLLEYEGKIGTLLQENTNLKGRLLKITQDLETLTTNSDKNLEENDSLKQKCNKLEILLTEIRLNEAKLKKELSNIKQNTKN